MPAAHAAPGRPDPRSRRGVTRGPGGNPATGPLSRRADGLDRVRPVGRVWSSRWDSIPRHGVMAGALIVVGLGGCAGRRAATAGQPGHRQAAVRLGNCGSCHALSHANTTGSVGPNLDDAFRQDRVDGVKSISIAGLVDYSDKQTRTPRAPCRRCWSRGRPRRTSRPTWARWGGRARPGHRGAGQRRGGAEGPGERAERSASRSSPASRGFMRFLATRCPLPVPRARWGRTSTR